ncbi:MAG TPA: winged helix DNA-binding domain-containing protein [Solirubrobacterales bacterium]|nr:winged helix DNA-binding domain-containing protein [Solirubrobacterales bacterium]
MSRGFDPEGLARLRAGTQLLHRPPSAKDPAAIARAIGGAQAQDVYAGPQQFRSRSRRLRAADIARARTDDRSLLRSWVMRMTIHLIPTEDAAWWLPLFEPGIERWSRRRLSQLGVPEAQQDRALGVAARALAEEGPLARSEVRERIQREGIELNSQTGMHIALMAVVSGIACLGPDRGKQSCLVRREDWLGRLARFDRDKAMAELARVYFRAFAPATDRDFAYWSGLPLRDVRGGLEAISSELEEVRVEAETMLAPRGGLPRLPRTGQVRMLGNFDTYLLGWKDRSFSVAGEHALHVKAGGGGWIRPVIVEDGIVVGGWRSARKGGRVELTLNLPKRELDRLRPKIEAEIADLGRFEGTEVGLVA